MNQSKNLMQHLIKNLIKNLIKTSILLASFCVFNACQNDKAKGVDSNKTTTATATAETPKVEQKTILFFGNSLTAAFGLDPQQGFVHLLQQRIDSLKMPYKCDTFA